VGEDGPTDLAECGAAADLPEARAHALSVLGSSGHGNAYEAFGQIALALICVREGDGVEAERLARAARTTLHALGLRAYFPHADAALLQVLIRTRDPGLDALADEALHTLETLGPMGLMDAPLRLWIARAHLAAGRREDAVRGLREALARLIRQAAAIPDPSLRERFLSDVPENADLLALARELGAGAHEGHVMAGPGGS
jgi:eukaryotic-like serine/threonine-protein kinase